MLLQDVEENVSPGHHLQRSFSHADVLDNRKDSLLSLHLISPFQRALGEGKYKRKEEGQ